MLHNAVCSDCNQAFGGTIDLIFARESAEGLDRYLWGIKPLAEIEKFRYSHVTLRAVNAGEFSEAQHKLFAVPESTGVGAEIVPSAAIREREGNGFVQFTEYEVIEGIWSQSPNVDWGRGVKLFGPQSAIEKMQAALGAQGVKINYRELSPLPRDTARLLQESNYSLGIHRAISKIAFNYLAYRRGSSYALLDAFDPIRRFVRFGEPPLKSAVQTTEDFPFVTTSTSEERPVVHFVSLNSHPSHRNLVGEVVLFGGRCHRVLLAEDFPGPWFDLPVSHLYNVKSRAATELEPCLPRWRHADRQ